VRFRPLGSRFAQNSREAVKLGSVQFALLMALLAWDVSACAQAQDTPLGDVARNIRKAKVATKPSEVLVDNDNFSKVMEDAESRRMRAQVPQLSFGLGPDLGLGLAPSASIASPDVTCSLAYTSRGLKLTDVFASGAALLAQGKDPKSRDVSAIDDKAKVDKTAKDDKDSGEDVPAIELAKLEGPAIIIGDSFQLSVYNGTNWNIQEITVGLTILRRPATTATTYASGSVVPASSVQIVAKRSDTTLLYHFKGAAAPNSKATFQQPLGVTLGPNQEWHWAIVEARGTLAKN